MDAATLAERLARQSRGLPSAVALVTRDTTDVTCHDCTPGGDFEIGSISKGVTGLLYAEALARAEVRPDTTLGELLPLKGSAAAAISLADLATHRSGLPRSVGGRVLQRSVDYLRFGANPYDQPLAELYADAARAHLRPGRPRYSNAGFQLFGQALAVAAAATYPDLVRRRIAEPLQLSPCYVPTSAAELLPSALPGHRGHRRIPPWAAESIGPAGGIRASIESMAGVARALLDGTAPGSTALDPVADFAGPVMRIGVGWMTSDRPNRGLLTWHNGGTGGFRSWLGLHRDAGVGVVVLNACTRPADPFGLALIDELAG